MSRRVTLIVVWSSVGIIAVIDVVRHDWLNVACLASGLLVGGIGAKILVRRWTR